MIVDGTGKVLERNDYYPFGARQVRSDYPQLAANRFKYNGKEEEVTGDLGYLDYGARMYDSGLGRWFGVDPFQESFYQDPSVKSYYDDERWNRYWKNEFGLAERQLTEVELAISNWYKSKSGKNEAIKTFLSHKGSNLLVAAWSETLYHLRSVESWVDGLSMTFVMKGMFENLAKFGIQYTKSSLKLGQKCIKHIRLVW